MYARKQINVRMGARNVLEDESLNIVTHQYHFVSLHHLYRGALL